MITIKRDEQSWTMEKIQRKLLTAKPVVQTPPVFVSEKVSSAIDLVSKKHHTNRAEIFSRRRDAPIVAARRDLMKIMYHEFNWSAQRVANYFKMDISTVQHHLGLKARSKVQRGAFTPA